MSPDRCFSSGNSRRRGSRMRRMSVLGHLSSVLRQISRRLRIPSPECRGERRSPDGSARMRADGRRICRPPSVFCPLVEG